MKKKSNNKIKTTIIIFLLTIIMMQTITFAQQSTEPIQDYTDAMQSETLIALTLNIYVNNEMGERVNDAIIKVTGTKGLNFEATTINGYASFRVIEDIYIVQITHPDYEIQRSRITVETTNQNERFILKKQETQNNLRLDILVLDEMRQPLNDVRIRIYSLTGYETFSGITNNEGLLSFQGLNPGIYQVDTRKTDYKNTEQRVRLENDDRITIILEKDTGATFDIISLKVRVTDEIRQPIKDTIVAIHDLEGNIVARELTDDAGAATFLNLKEGNYVVSARKENYLSQRQRLTISGTQTQTMMFNLVNIEQEIDEDIIASLNERVILSLFNEVYYPREGIRISYQRYGEECEEQITTECYETDGGLNFYKKGITRAGILISEDVCHDERRLVEYVCGDVPENQFDTGFYRTINEDANIYGITITPTRIGESQVLFKINQQDYTIRVGEIFEHESGLKILVETTIQEDPAKNMQPSASFLVKNKHYRRINHVCEAGCVNGACRIPSNTPQAEDSALLVGSEKICHKKGMFTISYESQSTQTRVLIEEGKSTRIGNYVLNVARLTENNAIIYLTRTPDIVQVDPQERLDDIYVCMPGCREVLEGCLCPKISIHEIQGGYEIISTEGQSINAIDMKIMPGSTNIVATAQEQQIIEMPARNLAEEGVKITLTRNGEREEIIIRTNEEQLKTTITQRNREAETRLPIITKDNTIKTEINNIQKAINILPEEASRIAEEALKTAQTRLELKEKEQNIVYHANAEERRRILGIIPATITKETTINAETGEITETKIPWYTSISTKR